MNRKLMAWALVVAGVAVGGVVALGPLNPPSGAVTSTSKTLTEVEPRIALPATGPITISQPGSYYLTGNIVLATSSALPDAVTISANAVTLDLNGFSITGGRSGIQINGNSITIRNGSVRSSGGSAIFAASGGSNCRVSNVEIASPTDSGIVLNSGAQIDNCVISGAVFGIAVGDGSQITRCNMSGTRNSGVFANDRVVIRDCIVNSVNVGNGIFAGNLASISGCAVTGGAGGANGIIAAADAQISRCVVSTFTVGIRTGVRSLVESCTTTSNQDGISAALSATIRGCSSFNNTRYGIELNNAAVTDLTSVVENCTVNSNGGSGIVAFNGGNHLIRNNFVARNAASGIVVLDNNQLIGNRVGEHVASGTAGISINGGGNLVQGNSFINNAISVGLNGGSTNNTVTGNTFRVGAGISNSGTGNTIAPIVGIGSVSAMTGAWVNVQY
jgi:hypothetical protein